MILAGQACRRQFRLDLFIAGVTRNLLDQVFLDRHVVTPRRHSKNEFSGTVFAEFKTKFGQDAQDLPARDLQAGNRGDAFRTECSGPVRERCRVNIEDIFSRYPTRDFADQSDATMQSADYTFGIDSAFEPMGRFGVQTKQLRSAPD